MSENEVIESPIIKYQKILKNRSILEMSHSEAKQFLLKEKSYCNFDLPHYITFTKLLSSVDSILNGKQISDFWDTKPDDYKDLNHIIFHNKDGKYAWRPLQLIHPFIYVALVHQITKDDHWQSIINRFKEFSCNPKIQCMSYPVESLSKQKDKAEQINYWWRKVEQKSIELALKFEYLIHTDIVDCYSSIYTHSIAWALHGKDYVKRGNKNNKNLVGNIIDALIRNMSHGQSNGLAQGSTLMDFIAEMVLGYADLEISRKIEAIGNTNYHIIRYRDDYRVFVNNAEYGEKILKIITETLIELGLKLNPSKTRISNQVVTDSIKGDKLSLISQKQIDKNLQKHLLIIHNFSTQFPNSGMLKTMLAKFRSRISSIKKFEEESLVPLISIVTDIAYRNPQSYPGCASILSKLINLIQEDVKKRNIIKWIKDKLDKIPNIGYLEIWLQRITFPIDRDHSYHELLCKIIAGENVQIWNSSWLKIKYRNYLDPQAIIDQKALNELSPIITDVELFISQYE